MKIAFFTEMGFTGKIPRTHSNMRTEFAWMCALDADHWNIHVPPTSQYDLGIIILPKQHAPFDITRFRSYCNQIAVMQEGPNWYWQDYELEKQIWYYNTLIESDIIFVHNESDRKYYSGLTGHSNVHVMPSLMIEDSIPRNTDLTRSGVIIGGNMTSWYSGFDSMIIAREFEEQIYAPSMGRKVAREDELDIIHLPYMDWVTWIQQLNHYKYGVHLMRTHAAGTFALNCAYLGIPCIGYTGLDTQMICHPETTVELSDLDTAKQIAARLRNDAEFYLYCSNIARQKYTENYNEDKFNSTFKKQFKVS